MGPEQNDYRFPHIQKGHFLEWKIVFHSNMSYMVLITISSIGSDNGLAPNRHQAIIWINDSLVYCVHMYVHHEVSMIRHETNICVLVFMIVVYPTQHVWHSRQSGFTSFTHHLQEQLRICIFPFSMTQYISLIPFPSDTAGIQPATQGSKTYGRVVPPKHRAQWQQTSRQNGGFY